MTDIDLSSISKQLDRLFTEQRYLHTDVQLLREEIGVVREQLSRIEYTITIDLLERLRALEIQE